MCCDVCREAVPARIDGEVLPLEAEVVDAQMAARPTCQAVSEGRATAGAFSVRWRIRPAA